MAPKETGVKRKRIKPQVIRPRKTTGPSMMRQIRGREIGKKGEMRHPRYPRRRFQPGGTHQIITPGAMWFQPARTRQVITPSTWANPDQYAMQNEIEIKRNAEAPLRRRDVGYPLNEPEIPKETRDALEPEWFRKYRVFVDRHPNGYNGAFNVYDEKAKWKDRFDDYLAKRNKEMIDKYVDDQTWDIMGEADMDSYKWIQAYDERKRFSANAWKKNFKGAKLEEMRLSSALEHDFKSLSDIDEFVAKHIQNLFKEHKNVVGLFNE